jgi:curved DNA-binding protein CbpA
MSLYAVLEVSSEASPAEIKAAFRRRIKELHPDLQVARPEGSAVPRITVHQLIEAYEILSDPAQREEYDRARHTAPRESEFNYREWLKARPDAESKAKLIFYDVLRNRSAEAVELYADFSRQRTNDLERLLGREDFMDCAFMLALEYENQGDDLQAIDLYRRIAQLEGEKAFFRHFFAEVEERLLNLLVVKRPAYEPPVLVRILEELQGLPFKGTAKAAFLIRQAEVFWAANQRLSARQSLSRARALAPRDKAVAKLEKAWGLR